MTAPVGSTTYYAIVDLGFTREWPSGLHRRTVIDESGGLFDEAWTSRDMWEPTTFFVATLFGDFTFDDVPYVEVGEAERIRAMGVRPRGGPFTEAGQEWLAAHPEDPAAKYLGVEGPVYDAAGRLLRPMGPVRGESPAQ